MGEVRPVEQHDREPGELAVSRWLIFCWYAWDLLTWPLTVRQLRQAGFRRTGWRTWESGPSEERLPACYRAPIGVVVHGPGCTCPDGGDSRR